MILIYKQDADGRLYEFVITVLGELSYHNLETGGYDYICHVGEVQNHSSDLAYRDHIEGQLKTFWPGEPLL